MICDRMAVIHQGRLSLLRPTAELSIEQVGVLMSASQADEPVTGEPIDVTA